MNVRKLRGIADELLEQSKFDEAYCIYDEIYTQMWNAVGYIHQGINNFSHNYLGNSYQLNYKLRTNFTAQIAETVFKRWFDLDVDQTLNEMTFTTFGHIRCICYSPFLSKTISADVVYNEFLILQTLVKEVDRDDWISQVLKIASPVLEEQRLKKLRPGMTDTTMKKLLAENAVTLNQTDWKNINVCIMDYLFNMGDNSSEFYSSIQNIVGNYSGPKRTEDNASGKDESKKDESNQEGFKYQSYEYYEKYERFESNNARKESFDPSNATEFEKAKYYGQILGLSGKISKSYIRKKYLELVAQYHPDKVFDLGDELKVLAEIKTKQINSAYDWMKKKFEI